jgi:hypothetical protein
MRSLDARLCRLETAFPARPGFEDARPDRPLLSILAGMGDPAFVARHPGIEDALWAVAEKAADKACPGWDEDAPPESVVKAIEDVCWGAEASMRTLGYDPMEAIAEQGDFLDGPCTYRNGRWRRPEVRP